MRKKSKLSLALMGGLDVATTTWAGVAPLIEAMRQTEVTGKADKVLALKKSSKGLTSGQMLECFVLLSTLGGECLEDMERLRQDAALSEMIGYVPPAPETARQWLDAYSGEIGQLSRCKVATCTGQNGQVVGAKRRWVRSLV